MTMEHLKRTEHGSLSIGDTRGEMGGWPEALHGAGRGEATLGRRKRDFRRGSNTFMGGSLVNSENGILFPTIRNS